MRNPIYKVFICLYSASAYEKHAKCARLPIAPGKDMNLHQLRFVREAVRQNFKLTENEKALFTSQPGVSKAIIELEEELGINNNTRLGKRIRGLTEPGRTELK